MFAIRMARVRHHPIALLTLGLAFATKPRHSRDDAARGALIPPQSANAMVNGSCSSIDDCSANGECIGGACVCDAAFTGEGCSVFNFRKLRPAQEGEGYRHYESNGSRVSSWCGAVLLGDDGKYHMWSSEMVQGAGIKSWMTNSQIIHAVADDPRRPWHFKRKAVVFPVWSHEPSVVRAPTGEYVMYFSTTVGHPPGKDEIPCSGALCPGRNGTSDISCPADNTCALPKSAWSMHTRMSYASTPYGPWSPPQTLPSSAHHDTNLACFIEEDGSAVCLGRPSLGRFAAKDWKNLSTYTAIPEPPRSTHASGRNALSALRGPGGCDSEDPFLWKDRRRGVLHVVVHAAGFPPWAQPWGFHAWSHDSGTTWRSFASNRHMAYGPAVQIEGQPPRVLSRRERPVVILDRTGIPVALSTAVNEGVPCAMRPTGLPPPNPNYAPDCPDDYSYTLVQPLVQPLALVIPANASHPRVATLHGRGSSSHMGALQTVSGTGTPAPVPVPG